MVSARWQPSQLADGWRFEPLRRVGGGATSEVWRARDRTTGQEAALKIGLADDAGPLLASEAERLAWLMSPELPRLLDLGIVPPGMPGAGRPFLALSWIAGKPLAPGAARSD